MLAKCKCCQRAGQAHAALMREALGSNQDATKRREARQCLANWAAEVNSLATTERSNARSCAARFVPKLVSNCACACDHALSAACKRFSPALVRWSSLARRSDAIGSIRIK